MWQTEKIIQLLKKLLKEAGLTYLDVAEHLNLSEASVKRMFALNHVTLKRVEQICELLQMDFEELITAMHKEKNYIVHLTQAQEQELVSNTRLFVVGISVLNRMTYDEMQKYLTLPEKELRALLQKLHTLGLIEFLPGNRIRLLIAHNFGWIPGGPIQTYFKEQLIAEYFDSQFDLADQKMVVLNAALSQESNLIIQSHIERLAQLWIDLEKRDQALAFEKKKGTTMIMAVRPWMLKIFSTYRNHIN